MLNWIIFDGIQEYPITYTKKEIPLIIRNSTLYCDDVFIMKANPAIIHDKNDRYTPVIINNQKREI